MGGQSAAGILVYVFMSELKLLQIWGLWGAVILGWGAPPAPGI